MSAEELTLQERELVRKLTSGMLFADPSFEKWIMSKVQDNLGASIRQSQGGGGVERYLKVETDEAEFQSTTETDIFVAKISGKTIALGGRLTCYHSYTAMCTDASNAITLRYYLGGTNFATTSWDTAILDGAHRPGVDEIQIQNHGAYNANSVRIIDVFQTASAVAFGTTGITFDTGVDFDFKITARWSGAGTQSFKRKFVGLSVFNPILP